MSSYLRLCCCRKQSQYYEARERCDEEMEKDGRDSLQKVGEDEGHQPSTEVTETQQPPSPLKENEGVSNARNWRDPQKLNTVNSESVKYMQNEDVKHFISKKIDQRGFSVLHINKHIDLVNDTGTTQGNNSPDEITKCHVDTDGTTTSGTSGTQQRGSSSQSSYQDKHESSLQQSKEHTDRQLQESQQTDQDEFQEPTQQSKRHTHRHLDKSQQTDQDEFQEPTQQSKRHTHRHLDRKCSNKEIHARILHEDDDTDGIVCGDSDDSYKPWSSNTSSEQEPGNIEENIKAASKELSELQCGDAAKVHKKSTKITSRTRWTHQEEESLWKYFHTVIMEYSLRGTIGSLPGRMDLLMFLEKQPKSFLANIPEEEKIMKIQMKLFNERAKCRRFVHLRETKLKL